MSVDGRSRPLVRLIVVRMFREGLIKLNALDSGFLRSFGGAPYLTKRHILPPSPPLRVSYFRYSFLCIVPYQLFGHDLAGLLLDSYRLGSLKDGEEGNVIERVGT